MTLTDRIQRAVIRTSPYPPFRWLYAAAYGAMLTRLMLRVRRMPEIVRLELRAPHKGHRFGVSDLDVRAETTQLSATEFFSLADKLADVLLPSSPWTRILDFYIFGPQEAQLQRRLGPMSFGTSRWIKLLGSKSASDSAAHFAQPAENAVLCRTMYEYGYLLQELFERTMSPHFTWTVFRRFQRIDDGFGARTRTLEPEYRDLRERMTARAASLVAGGRVRELEASDLEELFAVALAEADSIAQPFAARDDSAGSVFRSIENPIAPENLPDAIASCAGPVKALCAQLEGRVQSAVLGCVPGASFDYRWYLILRDDLSRPDRVEVFRAIRAAFTAKGSFRRIPNTYLRLRYPMVLTRAMWRASSHWYHALRPVEESFFFQRHGAVLWGDDVRGDLAEPAALDVIRSAAIATADLRNIIWGAAHDDRPRRLADLLLGRVPALWLLLKTSSIATSSVEAVMGCAAAGFPDASVLEELHARLAGLPAAKLPSVKDPMWKPALDASSKWVDDIAEMALARLDAHSEDCASSAR
jgi:hypothetical protein